jgi:hypothetical protein
MCLLNIDHSSHSKVMFLQITYRKCSQYNGTREEIQIKNCIFICSFKEPLLTDPYMPDNVLDAGGQ